jgi:cytochrome b561
VLILAIFRAAWRLAHPIPPLPASVPQWQRLAARTDQGLLYVLIFLMPLTGLIDAAAFSQPVRFFFLFDLPTVIAHNEPLGHAAFAVHKIGAKALYVLLFLHASAALYHHYLLKDDVLRRMLPR